FITTAGIAILPSNQRIHPRSVRPGDAILVSGDLGRHGMAIMSVREGLEFGGTIESDSAPVAKVILKLIEAEVEIHCLRDLTRGGLAGALNEIAEGANARILVKEKFMPVREDVHAACEILGLDPLHVACEGRFVAFVPATDAARALAVMQADDAGTGARLIGTVQAGPPVVVLKTLLGSSRILDMPSGEQLPRIC